MTICFYKTRCDWTEFFMSARKSALRPLADSIGCNMRISVGLFVCSSYLCWQHSCVKENSELLSVLGAQS